jgi:signal transduction histidine kinase
MEATPTAAPSARRLGRPARRPRTSAGRTAAAARASGQRAWYGLAETLIGRDVAPQWRWRSSRQRQVGYAALGLTTLLLAIISVASTHPVLGQHQLAHAITAQHERIPWRSLWRDVVAVAVVAPLPLSARYPLMAWRIGWVGLLLVPEVATRWWGGWPWGPAQVLALVVAFGVAGLRHQRPVLWWMWALTLIPWWMWLQADMADLHGPVGASVVFTAGTIALDSISSRLRAQRALTAQTERTEAERGRRAVLEERTRIARELHDVVAHHMSLIAVQAETAPYRLADLPESARAEFSSMSGTAREALADMRRLLGVLRQDQPAVLAPQPQLSDLPGLVDAARRAGVSVCLSAPADLSQVPPGIGLCAYRIVQESLSNAGQHAGGAEVSVSVEKAATAVVLRVANGPGQPGGQADARPRAGHGLTGMRERVSLLGGSLSAGPVPGGGFVVSAVLPLGEVG